MNDKILIRNIIITLIGMVIFSNCGDKHPATPEFSEEAPVAVKISTTSTGNNPSILTASGKIEASDKSQVSTRMMGYIERMYVKVGDKVTKGQLLVSINNIDLDAQMAQVNAGISEAKIALANAEKDYYRFLELFNENSATQKEVDDITTQYKMAEARVESAQQKKNEVNAQYAYSSLKAPISGVITNKIASQGDMANPGQPLLEIESQKILHVATMVPESDIANVQLKSKVEISIKSIDQNFVGIVTEISPSSANTGGQYLVKVKLNTLTEQVRPGMYAHVEFPVEKTGIISNSILIPESALVHQGELSGVYTVSLNNKALLRWLRLGRKYGTQVEVLSGLSADETYIVSAQGKLFNGANITFQ